MSFSKSISKSSTELKGFCVYWSILANWFRQCPFKALQCLATHIPLNLGFYLVQTLNRLARIALERIACCHLTHHKLLHHTRSMVKTAKVKHTGSGDSFHRSDVPASSKGLLVSRHRWARCPAASRLDWPRPLLLSSETLDHPACRRLHLQSTSKDGKRGDKDWYHVLRRPTF